MGKLCVTSFETLFKWIATCILGFRVTGKSLLLGRTRNELIGSRYPRGLVMQAAEFVVMLPLLKRPMIATPIGRAALDAVLLAIQSHALGHMRVVEPSALGAMDADLFYLFDLLLDGRYDTGGRGVLLAVLLPLRRRTESSSCARLFVTIWAV